MEEGELVKGLANLSITATSNENDSKDIVKCLESYCVALDAVNNALEMLLRSQTELKTLEAVESVLQKNRLDEDDRDHGYRSDVIPEEVKCPICFNIYQNEIWQCLNGHGVCGLCRLRVTTCSECRVELKTCVRNRALESLLGNKLKVDCPNAEHGCRTRLLCKEVENHLRCCHFRRKSEELLKVEQDMHIMKEGITTLEKKIEKLERKAEETRAKWNCLSSQYENRLALVLLKNKHQLLKKEMRKCDMKIKIKSLVYFNQ